MINFEKSRKIEIGSYDRISHLRNVGVRSYGHMDDVRNFADSPYGHMDNVRKSVVRSYGHPKPPTYAFVKLQKQFFGKTPSFNPTTAFFRPQAKRIPIYIVLGEIELERIANSE